MDDRRTRAAQRFEAAHLADPSGKSAAYHERLLHWVRALAPDASEALELAARCQHIRRWEIPRSDFPEGLGGYKRWRTTLARHHATLAEAILREAGYDDDMVALVRALLIKKGLGVDPEVQLFEDAICLVFVEQELSDFAKKHDEGKLVTILQKTWKKMSPAGHAAALALAAELPDATRTLLTRALG